MNLNRLSLIVLYTIGLLLVGFVLVKGLHYYIAPLELRPHLLLHSFLKPSGKWGSWFGHFRRGSDEFYSLPWY